MPLPSFQELMLPLLNLISDRNVHKLRDITEELAQQFNLSIEEREVLLPSGRGKLFNNRVSWARFYLIKAGLVSSPRRGTIVITNNGLNAINQNPQIIDRAFLSQFEEFKEFLGQMVMPEKFLKPRRLRNYHLQLQRKLLKMHIRILNKS